MTRPAVWLVVILLVTPEVAFGQITYEPGYFISSNGKLTECQIKNLDWKSNPTTFEYQLNGTEGKGDLLTVSEFGITGGSVFRRFTVNIDRSSGNIEALTKFRNPNSGRRHFSLRQLVGGKAVLYMYDDQGLVRFFYSHEGSAVSQLVYKRYLQTGERGFETGFAAENEQYKQQLFTDLKCGSITQRNVEKLKYERSVLMKFFNQYNACTGTVVKMNEAETPKSQLHISLLAGVGINNCSYFNGYNDVEFQTAAAMRFGAELEMVLPFYKGMWSVTFQPIYQSYSSQTPGTTKITYQTLDLGVGVRRYLFIKDKNSLYVSAGGVYGLVIDGLITYPTTPPTGSLAGSFIISSGLNLVAGVGYRVSRVSAELSYGFSRRILNDYYGVGFTSSYSGVIVTLGYRFK